jgi:hypothetical protein
MTVTTEMHVRVWVTDVWDTVDVALTPDSTVAHLKKTALAQATGREPDPSDYVIKFRGAEIFNEQRTLHELGAPDGAPFIVLPRRRQPVR